MWTDRLQQEGEGDFHHGKGKPREAEGDCAEQVQIMSLGERKEGQSEEAVGFKRERDEEKGEKRKDIKAKQHM